MFCYRGSNMLVLLLCGKLFSLSLDELTRRVTFYTFHSLVMQDARKKFMVQHCDNPL